MPTAYYDQVTARPPRQNPQPAQANYANPMTTVMNPGAANPYRGGTMGVERDFGLRDMFAQGSADFMARRGGLATEAQVNRSRGDLEEALSGARTMFQGGGYTPGSENAVLAHRKNEAMRAKEGLQKNLNATLGSMGLGMNAGASAALGFAGDFAAAGQSAEALAGIEREKIDNKFRALESMGGLSELMATLGMAPTQENMGENGFMGAYDQWRNADIGYDGYQWDQNAAPPRPNDIYAQPVATKRRRG
jgi:hypothetical protein